MRDAYALREPAYESMERAKDTVQDWSQAQMVAEPTAPRPRPT